MLLRSDDFVEIHCVVFGFQDFCRESDEERLFIVVVAVALNGETVGFG